jgi:hypothetical protein
VSVPAQGDEGVSAGQASRADPIEVSGHEQEGIRPEDAAHEEQLAPIA